MADTNDVDMSEDQSVVDDVKTAGQPLSEFLLQLEDYTPTVTISLVSIKISISN